MPFDLNLALRLATAADIPALDQLIETSVRTLQRDDYTPEQIAGALGTVLGLDTQLVSDGTYFIAEARAYGSDLAMRRTGRVWPLRRGTSIRSRT